MDPRISQNYGKLHFSDFLTTERSEVVPFFMVVQRGEAPPPLIPPHGREATPQEGAKPPFQLPSDLHTAGGLAYVRQFSPMKLS